MADLFLPRANIPIGSVMKDGTVTTSAEFVRFFESLVQRVGGVKGASSGDLTLSQFEDAGIEETKAEVSRLADAAGQVPAAVALQQQEADTQLAALWAEVQRLRVLVEALQIGTAP